MEFAIFGDDLAYCSKGKGIKLPWLEAFTKKGASSTKMTITWAAVSSQYELHSHSIRDGPSKELT